MVAETTKPTQWLMQAREDKLERQFMKRIAQRTWGRIQRLQVKLAAGRVIVQGTSPTYYLKQLALHAVREVDATIPMELQIQVSARPGVN